MRILGDLRYAVRLLGRSPLFTATAVASLALGIAATTAIFSLTDALLLRPRHGIVDTERVVDIGRANGRGEGFDNFGYPLYQMLQARATSFESMAATELGPNAMSLGDGSASERVFALLVSDNYFHVLGTRVAAGRFFLPEEGRTPGERPVVALSYAFWQSRFEGRNDVIGTSLPLNGLGYTIVGVAEEGFTGTTIIAPDFWVPTMMAREVRGTPDSDILVSHEAVWHPAIGRLKPGVTREQARAELNAIYAGVKQEYPKPYAQRDWSIAVESSGRIPAPGRAPTFGFLGLLFGLTGIVLLIACSNVAGMLLARATARRREMATRLAIGAGRGRLLGQLLTETLVIYAVAAAVAVAVTFGLVRALTHFMPALPVPVAMDLQIDLRVFLFALAIALAAGLTFGLSPARHALGVDLAASLHGQHGTGDRRRVALRHALVIGQVALSLLLLVTTGLFLRALQIAADIDPGFDPRNVEVVTIDTTLAGYRDQSAVAFLDRFMERLRAMPGVAAVATGRTMPLEGSRIGLGELSVPGSTSSDGTDAWRADWDVISPEYFRTLRLQLVEGRDFSERDGAAQPSVAIINESFARRAWPGQSAVGQRVVQHRGRNRTESRELEVIGVARDAKYASLAETTPNFIYVPEAQQPQTRVNIYIRHTAGRAVTDNARAILRALEPRLPLLQTQALESAIAIGVLPQRVAAWIAGSMGTVGLLLAALGLYGLMSFSVAQRAREIAVRMAVGAAPRAVLSMILGSSARLAATGSVLGLVLAVGASTLLQRLLFGLGLVDLRAFTGAALLLSAVLLAASWVPARRATRLDPAQTLKAE